MTATMRIEAAVYGLLLCMTPQAYGKTAGGSLPRPPIADPNDHSTMKGPMNQFPTTPSITDAYTTPIQTQTEHPIDENEPAPDPRLVAMQPFPRNYTPGFSSSPYLPDVVTHIVNELQKSKHSQVTTEKTSDNPSPEITLYRHEPIYQPSIYPYLSSGKVEPSAPPIELLEESLRPEKSSEFLTSSLDQYPPNSLTNDIPTDYMTDKDKLKATLSTPLTRNIVLPPLNYSGPRPSLREFVRHIIHENRIPNNSTQSEEQNSIENPSFSVETPPAEAARPDKNPEPVPTEVPSSINQFPPPSTINQFPANPSTPSDSSTEEKTSSPTPSQPENPSVETPSPSVETPSMETSRPDKNSGPTPCPPLPTNYPTENSSSINQFPPRSSLNQFPVNPSPPTEQKASSPIPSQPEVPSGEDPPTPVEIPPMETSRPDKNSGSVPTEVPSSINQFTPPSSINQFPINSPTSNNDSTEQKTSSPTPSQPENPSPSVETPSMGTSRPDKSSLPTPCPPLPTNYPTEAPSPINQSPSSSSTNQFPSDSSTSEQTLTEQNSSTSSPTPSPSGDIPTGIQNPNESIENRQSALENIKPFDQVFTPHSANGPFLPKLVTHIMNETRKSSSNMQSQDQNSNGNPSPSIETPLAESSRPDKNSGPTPCPPLPTNYPTENSSSVNQLSSPAPISQFPPPSSINQFPVNPSPPTDTSTEQKASSPIPSQPEVPSGENPPAPVEIPPMETSRPDKNSGSVPTEVPSSINQFTPPSSINQFPITSPTSNNDSTEQKTSSPTPSQPENPSPSVETPSMGTSRPDKSSSPTPCPPLPTNYPTESPSSVNQFPPPSSITQFPPPSSISQFPPPSSINQFPPSTINQFPVKPAAPIANPTKQNASTSPPSSPDNGTSTFPSANPASMPFQPVKEIPSNHPFRQGLRNYLKEKREAATSQLNSNDPTSTDSASIPDPSEAPADTSQQ
ncbi:unnamed protein product [Albugo candida]|uniref:Uncharacterized protein n=1 Tax=Albugo candida TaxID=65357 RepID=A0A024FT11_9STRA|nr:unnamed protein product [Albugo candida]|eukprot:CCI10208.1 unnamed protein product [Albugo candida]